MRDCNPEKELSNDLVLMLDSTRIKLSNRGE